MKNNFKTFTDLSTYIKEHSVCFIDFRFTDTLGKWCHITCSADAVDENTFKTGFTFDGSSIAGWQPIENSDLVLIPEISSAFLDPFTAQATLSINCNVFDHNTNDLYEKDPRSTAKRAEQYLVQTGIADTAYFGPEMEFFIFDSVRFEATMNRASYEVDSEEGPYNSGRKYEYGNNGHRPGLKTAYFAAQPMDSLHDLRSEILETMSNLGLKSILHHHEVAPSQCEISFKHNKLLETADSVQKCKYIARNVAHSYGKSATFMPKPVKGDNGSGMHCHNSLWKDGQNIFTGNHYSGLSEECLFYIGGIFKHAKALNAFTNPSTNSYKRLLPGFEAPTTLAYSARNRSAAVRIPYTEPSNQNAKRIELRFVDAIANPYLAFAAIMMAGIDGIENKIHPGEAADINLYDLPSNKSKKLPALSSSLPESLAHLDQDRQFLTKGNVFTDSQIDNYIKIKLSEIEDYNSSPHPIEFIHYYSL
ncbi:glutamine synthetase [Rickettsiales bacterium]|nr:glutamine synthetase [Rickettsiales bacterium]